MDIKISWCEDFLFNLEYIRHAHSFYALQAPVYYYVKRKGSLISQGMNISSTLRMKINVFEYYNGFYKDIYDGEDYNNIRPQIYRFLLAVARDGAVLPLPGRKKLGMERSHLHNQALSDEGLPMDNYRFRKLLEYQLEIISRKNNITLEESRLLYHLYFVRQYESMKEMSDFVQMSPLIKDFEMVEQDFDSVRFSSFSPEEQENYRAMTSQVQENIGEFLSRI